jgi:hypothetical protein
MVKNTKFDTANPLRNHPIFSLQGSIGKQIISVYAGKIIAKQTLKKEIEGGRKGCSMYHQ